MSKLLCMICLYASVRATAVTVAGLTSTYQAIKTASWNFSALSFQPNIIIPILVAQRIKIETGRITKDNFLGFLF